MTDANGTLHLTGADFDTTVGKGLALVDFSAAWCGPCRAMSPHVDTLATDLRGQVTVAKVDIDESPELAERFGVMGVPTFLLFQDGKVADRLVGAMPPSRLRARVDALRQTPAVR